MKISNISNVPLEFSVSQKSKPQKNFEEIFENFISDVNSDLKAAKNAKDMLVNGKAKNIVEVMAQIEKASISFTFLTEVRNKALESYQDIMRMQV